MSYYKESFYNFKRVLDDGRLMIYNTKTGAISLLDSDEKDLMQSVLYNQTECKSKVLLDNLLSQGFIIENDKNELDDIKSSHESFKRVKNVIRLIILPAEACNFTCPYCFIYRQRNMFMSQWVYEALYKYILTTARQNANTSVQLSWYGGEPLLASDKIIAFMKNVNELKNLYNINIDSSLYTNGYLLTGELFQELLECGITTFQVTIDGDRNSHDQLRRLVNGDPTFDVIYNNLLSIKKIIGQDKKFKFYMRANFLKSGIPSMKDFLSRFAGDFGDDKRFQIYFRPVYHFSTTRNDVDKVADAICDSDEGLNFQMDLSYKVLNKLSKLSMDDTINIFNPLPKPIYTWCTGRSGNIHIIGADGSVFMCDTMMVEKEKSVGQITADGCICLNEKAKPWTKSIFEDDQVKQKGCYDCRILPLCMGGCKLSMDSGHNACFWNEKAILDSMKKYADFIYKKVYRKP